MSISKSDLDWYAARLAIAVHDTNAEIRMGIHDLREGLKHIPGGKDVTMRYENGGAVQVFLMNGEELRFDGGHMVSASDIQSALEDKKKL